MDERIKEKLINRAKTNPYVNFLGIDFTVIEEGRVERICPCMTSRDNIAA